MIVASHDNNSVYKEFKTDMLSSVYIERGEIYLWNDPIVVRMEQKSCWK